MDSTVIYPLPPQAHDTLTVNLLTLETYFSKDSLLHPELTIGSSGVAGDPVPWTVHGDNFFTSLLLTAFVVYAFAVGKSRMFVSRQLRTFFFSTPDSDPVSETTNELRIQFFLALLTCLLLGITTYIYVTDNIADTFTLDNDYQVVALLSASYLAYFVLKLLLQDIANRVFFDMKRNLQWLTFQLFAIAALGVLIFPAVLLLVYFGLSEEKMYLYCIFVLFVIKIMTFYKCWTIFFRQKVAAFQSFLYLCTLEIAPILTLAAALLGMIQVLEIKY